MPRSITGKQLMDLIKASNNTNSKKEVDDFNPNIITGEEIEEEFTLSKSEMMSNIYYRMLERCDLSHSGIMGNPENSSMFDFFELIKNNIDIRCYYKQKYKL